MFIFSFNAERTFSGRFRDKAVEPSRSNCIAAPGKKPACEVDRDSDDQPGQHLILGFQKLSCFSNQ